MKQIVARLRMLEARIKMLDAQIFRLSLKRQAFAKMRDGMKSRLSGRTIIDVAHVRVPLTDAVLKILDDSTSPLSPLEIYQQLIGGDYPKSSVNFYATVYSLCSSLAKRGLIKETVKNDKKAFEKISP